MIGLGLSVSRRRRAAVVPAFVLDFLKDPAIPAGWTFRRASAATYYTDSGLLVSAAPNEARFDHDPFSGSPLGLRLESSRVNLLTQSEGFTVGTRCTLTQRAGKGADGKLTTTRITEDTTPASTHYAALTFPATANVATTYSAYFRANSRTQACLFVDSAAWSPSQQALAIFDIPTAKVVTSWNCMAGIERCADGMVRVWLTATSSTSVGAARALAMPAANGQNSYDGAGGTLETWGWQVEPNASSPSSYMPTAGSSFTRQPDYLSTTDLSALNESEGTMLFDGSFQSVSGGGMFAFSLDDTVNNGIGIYKTNGGGNLTAYSGSTGGTNLGLSVTDGQRFRAAVAWSGAGASASASVNGLRPVAVSGANAVKPTELCIGGARNHQFASNVLVRSLTYWPRRLSDTELAAATILPTIIAVDQKFGDGDGSRTSFQLVGPDGQALRNNVAISSIYRDDWQGHQALYATPRTNWMTNSNNFVPWAWTSGIRLQPDAGFAPDGVTPVTRITCLSTTNLVMLGARAIQSTDGADYRVISLIVKPDGLNVLTITSKNGFWNVDDLCVHVNLDTGVVTGYAPWLGSVQVTPLADGWFEVSVNTGQNTGQHTCGVFGFATDKTVGSCVTNSAVGDDHAGMFICCGQYELQSSAGGQATNRILTGMTASTVTDYTVANGLVSLNAAPLVGSTLTWSGAGQE